MRAINLTSSMKSFRFLLLLTVGLSLSLSVYAQKKHDQLSFPEIGKINIPKITQFTGKNGIRYYLVENNELPLISVRATIYGGDIFTSDDKIGAAGIAGTVMRSGGTEKYPADKLNEMLENKAASIETSMGFASSSASMSVLKEDFDALIPVFVDVIMNPAFPEDKIDLDKKQTKSAISRRNEDAQGIADREFERLIYGPKSVYGRMAEMATIDAVTREDLVAIHKSVFVGSNMYVAVIGDFNAKDMKKKIEKALKSIPKGKQNKPNYPEIKYTFKKSINFINKEDVNQSAVFLGHLATKRNDDYPSLQLMNEILSGGFSGRLMQSVRTDMGLAYGVYGAVEGNISYEGRFYAGVMTKSETTAAAIDAIIVQIKRLQDEPVGAKELEDAKNRILNSTVFRYDSPAKILYEKLNNDFLGQPKDAFDRYIDGVKKTSVADIQRVAKKYLKPDMLEILVVGNKNELGDQLNRFGKVNEIDITIPIPGMEKAKVKGDAGKAKELLGNMSKAILGSTSSVSGFEAESETTQFNERIPGGSMTMGTKSTVTFPENLKVVISAPQGEMTMTVEGSKGSMSMGPNSQPLPPQQISMMKADIQRNPLFLAMNYMKLDAVFTGKEAFGGVEYLKITVNAEQQYSILLDTKTNLPAKLMYSQVNPMSGEAMMITENFMEWTDYNGVKYPAKKENFGGDKKASSSAVKTFKVLN